MPMKKIFFTAGVVFTAFSSFTQGFDDLNYGSPNPNRPMPHRTLPTARRGYRQPRVTVLPSASPTHPMTPPPASPGHASLGVSKSGVNIILEWSGEGGPYTVSSATKADFSETANVQTLALDTTTVTLTLTVPDNLVFFDVNDAFQGEPTAPVGSPGGIGYQPPPFPTVTSVVPVAGGTGIYPGDEVFVRNMDNSYDPLAVNNQVFWNQYPVRIIADTGNGVNQLRVKVPEGGTSGFVQVCSFSQCSAIPPFYHNMTVLVTDDNVFTNPRGLAWDDGRTPGAGDHSLRVVDQAANQIYTVDPRVRQGNPQPLITGATPSRPIMSTMVFNDGSALYVSENSGSDSDYIWKIGRTAGAPTQFAATRNMDTTDCHGVTASAAVEPRGITLDPLHPDRAYLCDNTSRYIRSIKENNLLTTTDSSFVNPTHGGHQFAFYNDPCPITNWPKGEGLVIMFEQSTRRVWDLNLGGCVGNTSIQREFKNGTLTSYTMNEVYNARWFARNAGRGISFAQTLNHYGFLAVAQPHVETSAMAITREQDPDLYIEPDVPTIVLTNKTGLEPYPSDCLFGPPPCQTTRGEYRFNVFASALPNDPNTGLPNYFWLRVVDPQDTAPYAPIINTCSAKGNCLCQMGGINIPGQACDNYSWLNLDEQDMVGIVDPSDGLVKRFFRVAITNDYPQVFTVRTSQRFAGDNIAIQAFYDDPSANPNAHMKFQSGLLTSGKRIYIERDHMFRKGGLLFNDFLIGSCAPNCNKITVYRWADGTVAIGDIISVFDEINTHEAGGETRTITDVVNNGDGTNTITLDSNLTKSHLASSRTGNLPNFLNLQSAGYGAVSYGGGACDGTPVSGAAINTRPCFYFADVTHVKAAFADGFVEVIFRPSGNGAVPYLPIAIHDLVPANLVPALAGFSDTWFKNQIQGAGTPPQSVRNNYFHLIGSSTGNGYDGVTVEVYDFSYVQVQRIENKVMNVMQKKNTICDTTLHELGHQLGVNACDINDPNPVKRKHDNRPAWCSPNSPTNSSTNCGALPATQVCTMNSNDNPNPMNYDGISRFCAEDLLFGDPLCGVTPPAYAPGAIRSNQDPD